MWHCSRCSEKIEDDFDVCWRCGAHRDGTSSQEFQEEPDDPSVPDQICKLPQSNQATGDETTSDGPPERALTQESLAALLLRFLGLYITAFGIVAVVAQIGHLLISAATRGFDDAVRHYNFESLMWPGIELIIGIYFLVGGQWVYDKILTPVGRSSPDDAPEEEEDGSWRT